MVAAKTLMHYATPDRPCPANVLAKVCSTYNEAGWEIVTVSYFGPMALEKPKVLQPNLPIKSTMGYVILLRKEYVAGTPPPVLPSVEVLPGIHI